MVCKLLVKENKELGTIYTVKPGIYHDWEAVELIYEFLNFRGVGTERLIYNALLLNSSIYPLANEEKKISVEIKMFRRYVEDNSGAYEAVIQCPAFPEGFIMRITFGLDVGYTVSSWSYGG
jgi:hypothetical protein